MKLLFDQHLSYKLVRRLNDLYPNSTHVRLEQMEQYLDIYVWQFTQENGYTIVSKDSDFLDIGLLHGYPPKLIWLKCGNTSTRNIENVLRDNFELIQAFIEEMPELCLELS